MPVTLINVNFIILWYRFVSVCLFVFFFVLCCSTVYHVILIKLINLPIFHYYYFFSHIQDIFLFIFRVSQPYKM